MSDLLVTGTVSVQKICGFLEVMADSWLRKRIHK